MRRGRGRSRGGAATAAVAAVASVATMADELLRRRPRRRSPLLARHLTWLLHDGAPVGSSASAAGGCPLRSPPHAGVGADHVGGISGGGRPEELRHAEDGLQRAPPPRLRLAHLVR